MYVIRIANLSDDAIKENDTKCIERKVLMQFRLCVTSSS